MKYELVGELNAFIQDDDIYISQFNVPVDSEILVDKVGVKATIEMILKYKDNDSDLITGIEIRCINFKITGNPETKALYSTKQIVDVTESLEYLELPDYKLPDDKEDIFNECGFEYSSFEISLDNFETELCIDTVNKTISFE